jgi:hypothetical protein
MSTEEDVIELIRSRKVLGMLKYGVPVDRTDLNLRDWLQHALEECLDQAIYLKRAIRDLDSRPSESFWDALRAPEPADAILDPELEDYYRKGGSPEC